METLRDDARRIIDHLLDMLNSHTFNSASDVYAADYVGMDLTSHTRIRGPEEAAHALERVSLAFPDLSFSVGQTVFENDRIAVYWTARGTHQAMVFNLPATGRPVVLNGVSSLQFANGKLVHGVHLWDMAALLRAVGLLPELDGSSGMDTFELAFGKVSSRGEFQSSS